jgi:hypothetical protein
LNRILRYGPGLLISVMAACGDPSGPVDMGPTESTLSVSFTGDSATCQVTASWDTCPDITFECYALYRSFAPGIAADTMNAMKMCLYYDAGSTTYADTATTWDTVYYYAIRTADIEGCTAWSNEDSVLTPSAGAGR